MHRKMANYYANVRCFTTIAIACLALSAGYIAEDDFSEETLMHPTVLGMLQKWHANLPTQQHKQQASGCFALASRQQHLLNKVAPAKLVQKFLAAHPECKSIAGRLQRDAMDTVKSSPHTPLSQTLVGKGGRRRRYGRYKGKARNLIPKHVEVPLSTTLVAKGGRRRRYGWSKGKARNVIPKHVQAEENALEQEILEDVPRSTQQELMSMMRERSGESAQEQPLSMSLAAKGGRRRRRYGYSSGYRRRSYYGRSKGKASNMIPKHMEVPLSTTLVAKGGRRRRYGWSKGKARNVIPKHVAAVDDDASEPAALEEVPRFASSNFNKEESTPLSMSLVGKGGRRRRRSYYGRSKGKARNLIPKHVEEEVLEDVPRSSQQELMSMMRERSSGSARENAQEQSLSMSLVAKGGRRRRYGYSSYRRRSYYGRSKGKAGNVIPKHVEQDQV